MLAQYSSRPRNSYGTLARLAGMGRVARLGRTLDGVNCSEAHPQLPCTGVINSTGGLSLPPIAPQGRKQFQPLDGRRCHHTATGAWNMKKYACRMNGPTGSSIERTINRQTQASPENAKGTRLPQPARPRHACFWGFSAGLPLAPGGRATSAPWLRDLGVESSPPSAFLSCAGRGKPIHQGALGSAD